MNGWRGRAADIFTKHGESRQKRSPPRGLTSRISSYSTTPYPTNGHPMTLSGIPDNPAEGCPRSGCAGVRDLTPLRRAGVSPPYRIREVLQLPHIVGRADGRYA